MDPCFEDAHVLARRIRDRELTCEALMRATLDRIAAVNGTVNAVVSLMDEDAAMRLARSADAGPVRGPLHGLPLAVKDLANAAGFPTSQGSPVFAGQGPAEADDIAIARMRAAGALVIGKTNTPEFGLGSHSYNPVHGVTRNPYDLTRSAGGSSGGAAAALACGMLPIADGSDMMGSLRNPAGWANVYGMRPSWGLVPSEPSGDTFLRQLSTLGPMARSPADLELLLRVQAGPDPRQPHGARYCDEADVALDRKVAWLGDCGGLLFEEGVLETCTAALGLFNEVNCAVTQIEAPYDRASLWEAWITLRSWQVAMELAKLYRDHPGQLKPEAIWETQRGLALSPTQIYRASVIRSDWFRAAAQLFETYDVLVMPTAQVWPFDAGLDWPKEIAGTQMDSYHRWMEVVVPASLIGLPAIAVPAGFGANGLPMGLQLIGRRGSDADLLKLAQSWHAVSPWRQCRPDVDALK